MHAKFCSCGQFLNHLEFKYIICNNLTNANSSGHYFEHYDMQIVIRSHIYSCLRPSVRGKITPDNGNLRDFHYSKNIC